MKIAIFTDVYTNGVGGIPVSIATEKHGLEKQGHLVYVFVPALDRFNEKNVFRVPSVNTFKVNNVPFPAPAAKIMEFILENYPEIKGFDIIHSHYEAGCSIAGLKLGKMLGIPTVQTMHGREDSGIEANFPPGIRDFVAEVLNEAHRSSISHDIKVKKFDGEYADTRPRAKMWELMIAQANFADAVVCPSMHFMKKLKEYGMTTPGFVVPNGIDDGLMKRGAKLRQFDPKNECLKIIFPSRVAKEKRLMVLLRALRMLSKKDKYELDVYGDGNESLKAESYVFKYDLNVNFHGKTPREDIIKALEKSHISATVSYDFDTQGYTVLEAVASGAAILLSDPDLRESIPKNGSIVASDPTAKALKNALERIFREPTLIEEMSKANIEGRDMVSEKHQVETLLSIYKNLI